MVDKIAFQVDTARVLQILAREIYDSPFALLRENVQNAYDAVRERFFQSGELLEGGRIDIRIDSGTVTVSDNGIGMDEDTLRQHFWKAGSSGKLGKRSQLAGVVGSFGIGAMANFGVCTKLTVTTRASLGDKVLRSVAERDLLRISEECITLEVANLVREAGTTISVVLDQKITFLEENARRYIEQYVANVPVPVYLNDVLISRKSIYENAPFTGRKFQEVGETKLQRKNWAATFEVKADLNAQVLVVVRDIYFGGRKCIGELILLQEGGQLMGMRSNFGLAAVPVNGQYEFGGIANLSFLRPTAGREALTRESIQKVAQLITLAESAASTLLAGTSFADKNNAFLRWMLANGRSELASKVCIRVMPEARDIPLGNVKAYVGKRSCYYYAGVEHSVLARFANESTVLLHVSQSNPRRRLQMNYITWNLKIPEVPDAATITRTYSGSELKVGEASILVQIACILRDDYLILENEPAFAEISHGVTILPVFANDRLNIYFARNSKLFAPLLEFHDKAYKFFAQLMKDFVRSHVFPCVQEYVPSSTRDGVEALHKLLQRNRELYRYEETDLGPIESVLGSYLSGGASLSEILSAARSTLRPQSQRVSQEQVGSIESVLSDVVRFTVTQEAPFVASYEATPPIIHSAITSDMKILTTRGKYLSLNNVRMFLGLSDRFMRSESDFFHTAHTTRILWGGHRVVYIFAEASGRLSMYYDLELREPINSTNAGGGMFPTTTIITDNRIYVPIPDVLIDTFKVVSGSKEFFVRFDMLYNDTE